MRRLGPEVNVCSLDRVKQQLGHSRSLHIDEMRLEESFRGPKPLSTHPHLPAVGELHHRKEPDKKNLNIIVLHSPCFGISYHYSAALMQ